MSNRMGDPNPPNMNSALRDKLAELELELAEGDITDKGYQKKKNKIIQQFQDGNPGHSLDPNDCPLASSSTVCDPQSAPKSQSHSGVSVSDTASGAVLRTSPPRRYARDDVRYTSVIREEAVKEALQCEPILCPESLCPSKRRQPTPKIQESSSSVARSESGSESDLFSAQLQLHAPVNSHAFLEHANVFHKMSDPTPATKLLNLRITDGGSVGSQSNPASSENAQSRAATGEASPQLSLLAGGGVAVRPSLGTSSTVQGADPFQAAVDAATTSRQQPMAPNMFTSCTGLVCPSRVSEKIQQLVNTLKRPKRRPLPEYFVDEDDQILVQPVVDPNAPKPLGSSTEPLVGEKLVVSSGLPRNIESALQRYAGVIGKTPALTCLDPYGRASQVLTYTKLLQRANRIAFLLLNKLGHRGDQSLKPRDRVALVYTSNDPISFLVAFYGCLLASVIPIAVEVPTTTVTAKKNSASQNMGFLLSSLEARVVLTNDAVFKSLPRSQGASGDIAALPGWPQNLIWINTDHHGGGSSKKAPKEWTLPERLPPEETIYIEYTYAKDGSVRGVVVSRKAVLAHCRALTAACYYSEGDVMVCVVDCRREAGLWHAALASVFNGMHVVFVPFNVLQVDPGSWIRIVTKYRASVAIVKSRDLHWALLAEQEHPYCNLSSLRALLVTDGHNPWSLNSCDLFAAKFKSRGLNPNSICPIAGSSETLTLSLRRPVPPQTHSTSAAFGHHANGCANPRTVAAGATVANGAQVGVGGANASSSAAARGIISIQGLSYGVVRVDTEDSFTSLTLQDCGQVLPGVSMVVVSLSGGGGGGGASASTANPTICRTDEVGELCIAADYTGTGYWGLRGQTGAQFCLQPRHKDGRPVVLTAPSGATSASAAAANVAPPGSTTTVTKFVRSGLIGFPGPASSGGLIFICGSIDGVLAVAGRRHNANDVIATVIAVQPTKIVYRGRIAVFSIEMLKDERIVVIAELRNGFSEEAAFSWMSQVLQAVDSIHQVSVYALALVPQNHLPRTPFGGIHVHEVRRLFDDGQLHPTMLLLCPHSAIQNLPQPRIHPPASSVVGASAMLVGQVVQGARLAEAHGRQIAAATGPTFGSMTALSPTGGLPDLGQQTVTEVLKWRATHTPDDRLFSVYNAKGAVVTSLTCAQLHQKAERLGSLLKERGGGGVKVTAGSVVALMFMPGTEMVCAFYACLYIGAIPVLVRPPQQPRNLIGGGGGSLGNIASGGSNSNASIGSSGGNSSGGFLSSSMLDLSASRTSLEPSPPPAQIRFADSVTMAWNVVTSARAVVCLTQAAIIKLIKTKEAVARVPVSNWPPLIDYEESWRRKLAAIYQPQSVDTDVAYLDFTPSTTGTFTGVEVTHAAAAALCRAQKVQCEFYPARELIISLEPYSGLSASLWLLTSIYCGHHSILVPPQVTEVAPDLWLTLCSQKRVREAFCSYATIKLATMYSGKMISVMKLKEVSLEHLRSLVIVSEERPRVGLTALFTKMFATLNLNARTVSTSFGCRANLAMCLQGASSPDITTVYVDRISLRNDRVSLLERGSPNSLCLMESGKLLPGVHVAIANPDTLGQCADSHLGEIWVSSPHNSIRLLGPFNMNAAAVTTVTAASLGGFSSRTQSSFSSGSQFGGSGTGAYENTSAINRDPLHSRFVAGDTERVYARTGFLGFVRRTELTQSDGALHDAVFVVGNLAETMMLRGMRFYPMDIENTVLRSHKKINECAVFTWSDLLVVVVEIVGEESEALDLVHPITMSVLREHQLIVGVVVVVDRCTIRIDLNGEKQRILLRDNFVSDELDPIYVSYNM